MKKKSLSFWSHEMIIATDAKIRPVIALSLLNPTLNNPLQA